MSHATHTALWIVLAMLAAALAHLLVPDGTARTGRGPASLSLTARAAEPSSALLPDISVKPLAPAPAEAQFAAIVQRPLFSPWRRPAEPRPVAKPVVSETPAPQPAPRRRFAKGRYRLLGVVIDEEHPVAVLKVRERRGLLHLRTGDEIDGWWVVGIERGTVNLKSGRAIERIVLRETGRRSAVLELEPAMQDSHE